MRHEWNGAALLARLGHATIAAIDETTEAAAQDAQANHWWQNRSDNLEEQIINEAAQLRPDGTIAGKFGTTEERGFYGYFLERRHGFLRPAADRQFPLVTERIRDHLV